MAITIVTKNSTTASKRPTAAQLVTGELGLNVESTDPGLYFEDSAGAIRKVGGAHYGATAPNAAAAGQAGNSVGELWYDTTNEGLYVYDGAAWQLVRDPNAELSTQAAAAAPTTRPDGTALVEGDLYYDTVTDAIYAWDGAAWVAVGGTAATLAEAAAGTLNTVYSSPQTAVPKDASGMTGAAIIPSGTDLQRPGTPVVGMQRFNTTSGFEEVYTGATLGWRNLAFVPGYDPAPADLVISANTTLNGNVLCKNLTINAGVTVTVANYGVVINCTETATINGSINADNAGGTGYGASDPAYAAGTGVVTGGATPSGWNGPGVSGKTYATGFYLGGSSPVSSYWDLDATGVGSGFSQTAGSAGGGCIAIRAAGAITVAATSTLSAIGQPGGGFPSATGNASLVGSCGGSGGTVILHSDTSISMAGTVNVQGGAGNNAGCAGTGCSRGLGGGNGGGGGQVILQSPSTSNTGAVTLTGGAGGAGIDGAGVGLQLGAPAGAGNGGAGGPIGTAGGSVNGSAGSNGILTYIGSPF